MISCSYEFLNKMIIKDALFLNEKFKNKLFADLPGQENSSLTSKIRNLENSKTKEVFDFEDQRFSKNEILTPSIKKESKGCQQSKKTIRSFWTTFLKPQLSTNLLTKNSDVYKFLLRHREFSLKDIREVSDHFIKKEGETGFLKVKDFYKELMMILVRNKNPNFNKYTLRLSNWCLPIISINHYNLSLSDKITNSSHSQIQVPIEYANQENLTITIPLEHYKELQACWLRCHQNKNRDEIESILTKHEVKAEEDLEVSN